MNNNVGNEKCKNVTRLANAVSIAYNSRSEPIGGGIRAILVLFR